MDIPFSLTPPGFRYSLERDAAKFQCLAAQAYFEAERSLSLSLNRVAKEFQANHSLFAKLARKHLFVLIGTEPEE